MKNKFISNEINIKIIYTKILNFSVINKYYTLLPLSFFFCCFQFFLTFIFNMENQNSIGCF
jgi:hypothetical protein